MLKVLIVDDEFIIREGLKTIINWEEHGFEVCSTAANGREGLQKIEQCTPELVIVDIKMPVMDGIKMVEELKQRGDKCKVIVLTAYSDFGFAQKLIELGIGSYVLKPVEQTDLIEKLLMIKSQVERENEARQNNDASVMLSRDKILEGFVTGTIDESMTEKYKKQYSLDFPWSSYRIGLVDTGSECTVDLKLKKSIRSFIEGYVSENSYGYVFDIDGYIGILLREMSEMSLPRIMKTLQGKVDSAYKVVVTISAGKQVPCLGLSIHSYKDALKLLKQKFLYGRKQIIISTGDEAADSEADAGGTGSFCMEPMLKNLQDAIDVNNTTMINNLLEQMKDWLLFSKSGEETIKISYTGLYLSIMNSMAATDETLKNYIADNKEVLDEICCKSSLQELHGYIKYKLLSLSEKLSVTRPNSPMKRILDYIDRNYARDIKLESLAAMFNYNCTYLGKLFKSQTGMYFNTYMDHVRIEKAKLLLGQGLKVYQVVGKVGISDIDYFYKKFKKYTGVSPSAFKGKCQ